MISLRNDARKQIEVDKNIYFFMKVEDLVLEATKMYEVIAKSLWQMKFLKDSNQKV